LTLIIESRIGKKYAVYLPKLVVEALNLKEGSKILLKVTGASVVLQTVQDPRKLALTGKRFASFTPDIVEAISNEEQHTETKNPA
jgi:AbrB family looped-hinge helix DNA binding protein